MPNLSNLNYTISILTILSFGISWWLGWLESPRKRAERTRAIAEAERAEQARAEALVQSKAVADAILGQVEERDSSGRLLREEQPGLVARTATLEQAVTTLIDQRDQIKDLRDAHGQHETRLSIIEPTLAALVNAQRERASMREENASMFNAIAERDTTLGEADEK